ncbi:MAG: lysostaphin resistance A-like protein [bacterium]
MEESYNSFNINHKFYNNKSISILQSSLLFLFVLIVELIARVFYKGYFYQYANARYTAYLFIGAVRVIDLGIIALFLYIGRYPLNTIGLSVSHLKKGLLHGIYWSLSFAGVVGLIGLGFLLFGKNPLSFFRAGSQQQISSGALLIKILIGCFLGPIVEDILFIGIIYNSIRKKLYLPIAIILSALFFASCHDISFFIHSVKTFLSCLGAPSMKRLIGFIIRFILQFFTQFIGGVIFALSFEFSQSILSPMIIHTSGNLALLLLSI